MSKGSGRRRITPADGIQYDEELGTTNIEQRGFTRDLGSSPTRCGYHGTHGERRGGQGKNSDSRNWKRHTKGKQYEHNVRIKETMATHKPVPEGLAARLRERSIAVLLDAARRRQMQRRQYAYQMSKWESSSYSSHYTRTPQAEIPYPIGFAKFEQKVKTILDYIRWNMIDEYGVRTY